MLLEIPGNTPRVDHGGDCLPPQPGLAGPGLARKATPVANVNVVYPLADTGFE